MDVFLGAFLCKSASNIGFRVIMVGHFDLREAERCERREWCSKDRSSSLPRDADAEVDGGVADGDSASEKKCTKTTAGNDAPAWETAG